MASDSEAVAVEVLLIDDDEDEFLLTKETLEELSGDGLFSLHWQQSFDDGLRAVRSASHHVCLLDYRLGERNGLELLHEATAAGVRTPIIFLTGRGDPGIERAAMAAGAADYLAKSGMDGDNLGRAIRHALERRRCAAVLEERDQQFRAVFDGAMDAIAITNSEGQFLDANAAMASLLGTARLDLFAKRVFDFVPPADVESKMQKHADMLLVGLATGQSILLRPDGTERIVEYTSTAHIMPGRHLLVLHDVTERARAAEAKMRLAAIVECADDAIVAKDRDEIITQWNPGAGRMFGYTAAEAVGRSAKMLVPPALLAEWQRMQTRARAGERSNQVETARQRKDGTLVDVSVTLAPMHDDAGALVGTCSITRDISEMTRMRARLSTTDRLAAVGQLAAGIAHEMNNPLTYVFTNIDYSLAELEKLRDSGMAVDEVMGCLKEAQQGAERIKHTSRDLKLFSRGDDERRGPVDLRHVVESSVNMAWNEIRHRARLVKDFGITPSVDGNESRLGQVVLNLLINAAQSIPEGSADDNEIRVATRLEGTSVTISVRDTGAGIRAEQLPRLFEPFYTTKPLGIGTGLGLSICHGIVEALGGTITVVSDVGRGSEFTVTLPIGELAREARPAEPVRIGSPKRRGRVLIIDDDELVGRGFRRLLQSEHDVEVVVSARDALTRLAQSAYDVVLCDLMMPDMTGMEIYDELRASNPDVADELVFVTGGAFTATARSFLERVPNERLEKPIDSGALRSFVEARVRRDP